MSALVWGGDPMGCWAGGCDGGGLSGATSTQLYSTVRIEIKVTPKHSYTVQSGLNKSHTQLYSTVGIK